MTLARPITLLMLPLLAAPAFAAPPAGNAPANGPAADYPVVLGAPYQAGGAHFVPVDTMNYDEVGHASVDAALGAGMVAAHHTLPLPCYVEVTALNTGRTIVVRVTRRGPMDSAHLLALSQPAARMLGLADGEVGPVRVRRVNPLESDRALLRAGQPASPRIDTPAGLLGVLRRRLGLAETVSLVGPAGAPAGAGAVAAHPAPAAGPLVAPTPALPKPLAPKPALAGGPADKAPPRLTAQPVLAPAPKAVTTPAPKAVVAPTPKTATASAPKPVAAPVAKPAPAPKPAASKPAAPKPAPAAPTTAAEAGYVVQVGAFSTRAHAETAARQTGGTVTQAGKWWRVRVGVGTNHEAAAAALAKAKGAGYSDARIQRAN